MKKRVIAAAVLAALGLVGCGSNNSSGGSGGSGGSGTDYVSKYLGTWATGCYITNVIGTDASQNQTTANAKDIYTITKDSNSQLRFKLERTYYADSCSTAVIAKYTYLGANTRVYTNNAATATTPATITSDVGDNLIKYTGTGTATKSGSSVVVDKFLITTAPLFPEVVIANNDYEIGTSVTGLNTITYRIEREDGALLGYQNMPQVVYLDTTVTPNQMQLGNGLGAKDATTGYPTTIALTPKFTWTKQ